MTAVVPGNKSSRVVQHGKGTSIQKPKEDVLEFEVDMDWRIYNLAALTLAETEVRVVIPSKKCPLSQEVTQRNQASREVGAS